MVRWRPTTDTEDVALSDAIAAELARLRDTVETLTQGLRMMVEAATEEAGESPLPGLLTQIVQRLDEQTEVLHRIEAAASGRQVDDDETPAGQRPGPASQQ